MSRTRPVTFTRLTPAAGAGAGSGTGAAINIFQLSASEAGALDPVCGRLGVAPVGVGRVGLRVVPGVDDAVLARPRADVLHISVHAGRAVADAVEAALVRAGVERAEAGELDPRTLYPEAATLVEACVLDALARADAPAAVDALLAQPRRWSDPGAPAAPPEASRQLGRLLCAPTVAAIGHANVGKSTLLNALARRDAALVADLPGTTLDHVGVTLTLDGVNVHWLDTPGWRAGVDADSPEHVARGLAARAVALADLVIACGDAGSGFLDAALMGAGPAARIVRVETRAARRGSGVAAPECDVSTDALTGVGLEALALTVAERLVPRALRDDPPRWVFHEALGGAGLSFPPRR